MGVAEMVKLGHLIADLIEAEAGAVASGANDAAVAQAAESVAALCDAHPIY